MLPIKIGLVDTTGSVDVQTMAAAAAAINVQVTRDLPQYWSINATVCYLPTADQVPQGVWPVQLVAKLPAGEGGFHMTAQNQPYAKVIATPGSNEWTIDASHEIIEMLVDPNGNRLQASTAIALFDSKGKELTWPTKPGAYSKPVAGTTIADASGQSEYLVEACDPCEADACSYQIDGISVSDFITPHFYDLQAAPGARYSFTGAVTKPRDIVGGGYITWVDPQQNLVLQILWIDPGSPPVYRNLGPATGSSLRLLVENKTHNEVRSKRVAATKKVIAARKANRAKLETDARERAKYYI